VNVCLYFYKSHGSGDDNEENYQIDCFTTTPPLASLPLFGYKVDVPSEEDGIRKEHVFKLSFKNHVYYFRAESPFTFQRWVNVLAISTKVK
jgi:FERM/RhoGEF/pleckstrin domain protein 2